LPYHDYLEATGDTDEDTKRRALPNENAVVPETADVMSYSYAGELAEPDVALSVLAKCLAAVRKVKEHGIASGPREQREEWLNQQIESTWVDRGAFPGAGAVMEALGTALVQGLVSTKVVKQTDDPWPVLDLILRGKDPGVRCQRTHHPNGASIQGCAPTLRETGVKSAALQ
jgi:hypothetical protein